MDGLALRDTSAQTQQPDPRRLHLDKTINLGHLLTTVSLVVAGAGAWMKLDSRVTTLESVTAHQRERDVAQDATMREKFDTIRDEMRDIRTKVDEIYRSQVVGGNGGRR